MNLNKFNRISDAVSPLRAAQFLQGEKQVAIFVDLNVVTKMSTAGSPVGNKP